MMFQTTEKTTSKRAPAAALLALALALGVCALALSVSPAGASKAVLSSFGEEGTLGGQFSSARELAVNSDGTGAAGVGDLYVTDEGNQRIQRFDGDGNFIETWGRDVDAGGGTGAEKCTVAASCKAGEDGTAEGEFVSPRGIAVNQASGDVYVFDRGNARVQQFTADGGFVRAWGWGVDDGSDQFQICTSACEAGIEGGNGGQFPGGNAAGSVAIDAGGNVYVSDPGNRRVQEFTAAGAFVRAWGWDVVPSGKPGNTGTEFEICTSTTAGDCQAGSSGTGDGQFSANGLPIAVDSAGNAYVTNRVGAAASNSVQKFGPSGNFAGRLATTYKAWEGIAVDPSDDHVYVAEIVKAPDAVIEEFDSAGALVDTHIPGGFGAIALNYAEAAPFAERIYSLGTSSRVDILVEAPPPSVSVDAVSAITSTTARLSGSVQPNGKATTYRLEYSRDGGATWVSATFPEIGLGDGTGSGDPDECPAGDPPLCGVSGQLEGLLPNTEYLARIVATNSLGIFRSSTALPFSTEAEAPGIGLNTSTAGRSSASLRGTVDPRGTTVTACHFEWGSTSGLGHSVPCKALPGAGQGPVQVEAQLAGLTSGTTYHYRLVATNQAGTTIGDDRGIEVGVTLPDHRAWEMVSPPDKNGGQVSIYPHRSRAAQELGPGQPMAFDFTSLQSFAGAVGAAKGVDYMAVRTPNGWRTHAITPPQDSPPPNALDENDALYNGEMSPDLSAGVVNINPSRDLLTPDSGPVSRVSNLYLRSDLRTPGRGSYELVSACPLCLETGTELATDPGYRPLLAGASAGFGVLAFDSKKNLVAGAGGTDTKAYEWERATGEVRLMGRVPPSGDRCDDAGAPLCVAAPSSEAGRGDGEWRPATVSPDGRRILFGTPAQAGSKAKDYFLRLGGHATIEINVSERTEPDASQKVRVWAATPDLRDVFFTTGEALIDEDSDECSDLYRYRLTPLGADGLPDPGVSHLTRVSASHTGTCANASGAVGVGADGGTVYFLAAGPLVPGEPSTLGQHLYRWQEGKLTYIASLSPGQELSRLIPEHNTAGTYTARTTPDGSHLFFAAESGASLAGYEHPTCAQDCDRFYVFDGEANAGEGELTCASCPQNGSIDTVRKDLVDERVAEGAADRTEHLNRPLSDTGRFAFFASANPLVPGDTNGRYDVYRYDSVNGSLALISSGEDAQDSYFLEAKGDGTDVFFATAARLSGWDQDRAYDAYDARIGGGLPEPAPPRPSCVGDACQPPPRPLNDATPASTSFVGAGNVAARKPSARHCPKGKRRVKRRGKERCVKRHAKKRGNRARKGRGKAHRRANHNHRRVGR